MARVSEKKCFSRKTNFGNRPNEIYVWCVDTQLAEVPGSGINRGGKPKPFCNATKGSQGYDNITKYVYQSIVVNGIQQNLAYVECDYVQ